MCCAASKPFPLSIAYETKRVMSGNRQNAKEARKSSKFHDKIHLHVRRADEGPQPADIQYAKASTKSPTESKARDERYSYVQDNLAHAQTLPGGSIV
jgi:hypothetical protein